MCSFTGILFSYFYLYNYYFYLVYSLFLLLLLFSPQLLNIYKNSNDILIYFRANAEGDWQSYWTEQNPYNGWPEVPPLHWCCDSWSTALSGHCPLNVPHYATHDISFRGYIIPKVRMNTYSGQLLLSLRLLDYIVLQRQLLQNAPKYFLIISCLAQSGYFVHI